MKGIDQAQFAFSPGAGIALAFMVGFLVFAVALDLKWEQFRRVFRAPKAPGIGLVAQFVVLPAVAFAVGRFLVDTPSVALGLLLVACCPGGALSNFFTGIARGDVATSVSMTAASTIACVVVTPLVFGAWASLNPATAALLNDIRIDPQKVVMVLMIMVVIPVTSGMLISARRPGLALEMRKWVRRLSMAIFGAVVIVVLGQNLRLLLDYATEALLPVLVTFGVAAGLGWSLAWLTRLRGTERRAVTIEVAMQNVALAIGTAVAFFPSLVGAAVTAAVWGVVHLVGGFTLAAVWGRRPTSAPSEPALAEGA